ncbi:protein kinase domain-containing protein [Colletotrichum simmondsii]|uniref:Protein kinase domain-containing protein n=1 Tax=Colletotrichum simmondsii TaxID=703756 RepID=A0A135T363_9PEZI|nr:protein kinase domain-containing protein [Colletotrichum simmondsii]
MEHCPGNEIYEATIRCDQTFEFSISEIQGGKYVLREFQQRFWAWATNAGALAEPCLSLDARLLNHEKPRQMVLGLLDLIQDNLQADVEHLKYPFQGLEAALQRLNIISSLIDHSSRKGRQRRLEALHEHTVTDSTLSFITDASRFESLAQAIIGYLWVGISGQLVMKLARSVLHRKQRIAYTRFRKQARQVPRFHGSQAQTEDSHLLTTPSVGDGNPKFDPKLPRQPEQVPSEWLRPSTVDGESFARGQLSSSGPTSDSRKTHSVWTKNIAYPKSPKASSVSDSRTRHAPCPFCQNMFPYQRYEDSDWWRTHVDHDLQPYVCVSDECSQPPMTFSNHNKWLQHMNDTHGPHWIVDLQEISYRRASEVVRESKDTPSCPMCLYNPPDTVQSNDREKTQPLELIDTERTPRVRFKEHEQTLGISSKTTNRPRPQKPLLKATNTKLSRHIAEYLKMLCFRMLSIDTNLSQHGMDSFDSESSSNGIQESQNTSQTSLPSGMDSEMGKISLNLEETKDMMLSEKVLHDVEHMNDNMTKSKSKFLDDHETTGIYGSGDTENSNFQLAKWLNEKPVSEQDRMASDILVKESPPQTPLEMESPPQSPLESLQEVLTHSLARDALNDGRRYVPQHVLDASVTRESVRAALKKSSLASRKFWQVSSKSIVDIAFSKNLKKLFVILLQLNVPWDLKKLHDAGFNDADLPVVRKETKDGHLLQSGLDPEKVFTPPKQWELNLVKEFVNKQWMMMAPLFSYTGQHQELDSKCPLPFLEANALIQSPRNIVYMAKIDASHQTGFEGVSAYIISPWAQGGDLNNFWTTQNDKERTAELTLWSLEQMLGLSEALYTLHELLGDAANCRHGDLKPGNILHFQVGSGEGILKITDFGISRIYQEATFDKLGPTTTGASPPSYEAPEYDNSSFTNSRSGKSDFWSLGGILLEFTIWLVQDWNAVQRFRDARVANSVAELGSVQSHFYKIEEGTMIVHPEVLDVIANLQKLPRSAPNTALGALLDIIKFDLIQIGADRRIGAEELYRRLRHIVRTARLSPDYLFGFEDSGSEAGSLVSQESQQSRDGQVLNEDLALHFS